jgi:hypothetical protein
MMRAHDWRRWVTTRECGVGIVRLGALIDGATTDEEHDR